MRDQADRLRQIIENLKQKQQINQSELLEKAIKKNCRVLTITSGKGGVGKTNITLNLAIALSELGYRIVILDADFGLSNIDVLFGIIPKFTLVDVIYNRKSIIEILADGPERVKFISGGSGVDELVKLEKIQIEKFVENMTQLDKITDIILVDTGAGINDSVMSFVMAADEVILVTTPEPTSLTDAYALVKTLAHKDSTKDIKVIVNRADNQKEAEDIINKLRTVAGKFLSINLKSLGYIQNDDSVIKSVKMQIPLMLGYPKSSAARQIREISRSLVGTITAADEGETRGMKGFVNRLVGFIKN